MGRLTRTLGLWSPRPAHRFIAPTRRFAILTTGRTGGNLLVSLLDSHPQIMCDGEVLIERRALPDQIVRSREALAGLRRARAYGFKLTRENMLRQGIDDPAAYVRALHDRGYRMILLRRRDLLQHAISFARAEKFGYHHHRRGDSARFSATTLDPMAVLALMYVTEDVTQFCGDALRDIPHLELVYEDDLGTPERQQATVEKVCRLLELDPVPAQTDFVRLTPGGIKDQVENYDELARVLAVTRYARYLPNGSVSNGREA